jgi:PAS domain S-box-containing protein
MKNKTFQKHLSSFHRFFVLIGILISFLPQAMDAQTQNLRFKHLSSENGLSQNTVLSMLQDRKGFMWFGTYDGLNRYDGCEFKVYKSETGNPSSLTGNLIRYIFEDHSGVFWIATDGGLNLYDREKENFIRYKFNSNDSNSLSSNRVRWMSEDQYGVLWIGTDGGGLNQFDKEREKFIRYEKNPHDPNSISSNFVTCVLIDRSGNLWIATDAGINRFDREKNKFIHYQNDPKNPRSLNGNDVFRIYEDLSGVLWIGFRNGGLDRFDREKKQFIHYRNNPSDPYSLSSDAVRSIYEDRIGRLWIGTWGGGLDQFDRTKNRFIHNQNNSNDPISLSNNLVMSIYEDRSGILWVGNDYGGINEFDGGEIKFSHYKKIPDSTNSLSGNTVYSIIETMDKGKKILWIGTQANGLNKFERSKNQFTHYRSHSHNPSSLSDNNVRTLFEGRTGSLWIGTNRGLNLFNRTNETFTQYFFEQIIPNRNDIFSVCEDRFEYIWIGTYGGGLYKFDPKKKKYTSYTAEPNNPNSLSDNFIWSILEDRSGTLWIGTESGGINQFDREKNQFIHYTSDPENTNGLSGNKILCILEDQSGMLWFGTTNGLNKFDRVNKRFSHYLETDGLPSNAVQSILEDNHGNLWLGTPKGLSRFDPRTHMFRNFKIGDGLQSNEFCVNACFKGQDGEMFFGGINGFNTFFPDSIKDNLSIPSIVITDFQIFNNSVPVGKEIDGHLILQKSITETEEIRLSYKESVFSFEFASLNLISPEENQYAYMMEGFDKGWNYTNASRRFATYTNMSGGDYVFRVRGTNSDGVWNENGISLPIVITPPFWQTLWFRLMLVAALLGVLFWIYKWRKQLREFATQKRMDAALTKERNLLRTVIDNIPDGIYVKDTASRKTIANLADVHNMNLRSEEEVLGKDDFEFYPKELAEGFYADDQSVIQTGQPVTNREEYVINEQGQKRWLVTTKLPLRDDKGQIIGLVGIGRDITKRKLTEEALRHERNLLRTLIDNLPDLIYVKDTECRKTIANLTDVHFMDQRSEADVLGKTDFDFYPKEVAEVFYADDRLVIETGQPVFNREEYALDKNEQKRWLLTAKLPLRDEKGQIIGLVGIGRDITERKKAEAERERLITELQNALVDVKTLSGLVPICANCKKIRDDQGYWTQVESYIQERSQARFSHGICPDCAAKLYPNYFPKK